MLTRAHFKIFAEILGSSETKREIIEKLTVYFKNDNVAFNAYKFREYINRLEHANGKTITSFSVVSQ
jgi:hypothetical protein